MGYCKYHLSLDGGACDDDDDEDDDDDDDEDDDDDDDDADDDDDYDVQSVLVSEPNQLQLILTPVFKNNVSNYVAASRFRNKPLDEADCQTAVLRSFYYRSTQNTKRRKKS